MPRPPQVYGDLLRDLILRHDVNCWLVNTGWSGGPYGTGHRMKIAYTRAMITAALSGALDHMEYDKDLLFNLDVPSTCPGVPPEVLQPRNTWTRPADYDAQAAKLAKMFVDNFKAFEADVTPDVKAAGPKA